MSSNENKLAETKADLKQDETHLTKRDVRRAAWYWMFFALSQQNYERMQGGAFCATLSRPLEKLYRNDKQALSEALKRNMVFFNTNVDMGAMIPGMVLALEEERANDPSFDPDIISSMKTALMGPCAGIGDSIIDGVLNPIFLSIGIGLSATGSPLGALVFLLLWCGVIIPLKYFLFMKGYELGADALPTLSNESLKTKAISALTVLGLIVIGGVAATTVKAPIIWAYTSGDMVVNLQQTLDGIMPGFFPMLFALGCYLLVDKKGFSVNKLLVFILAFAGVMTVFGIM